jgi:hypothetical protein
VGSLSSVFDFAFFLFVLLPPGAYPETIRNLLVGDHSPWVDRLVTYISPKTQAQLWRIVHPVDESISMSLIPAEWH